MPSRHSAVGFAGCATRLVPSRGHSALIPGAFGLAGPRTPLGKWQGCERVVHRVAAAHCCAAAPEEPDVRVTPQLVRISAIVVGGLLAMSEKDSQFSGLESC